MPKVICNLPNASDEISGVKFSLMEDGRRISDEIDASVAARFASISGYELDEVDDLPPVKTPEPVKAAEPVKAKSTAKAEKAAAEKAAKEEAEKLAAEQAAKEAEELAAKEEAEKNGGVVKTEAADEDEVF